MKRTPGLVAEANIDNIAVSDLWNRGSGESLNNHSRLGIHWFDIGLGTIALKPARISKRNEPNPVL
jgi:hypothetical protein